MKAELVGKPFGDDLTIVNAARVSFDKESEWDITNDFIDHPTEKGYLDLTVGKELLDKDKKLIHYLAKHNHYTPFTHCAVRLRETVPIFVARQRFKHTVGFSYNEVSRRYVNDNPAFYFPQWRLKAENKKQGSAGSVTPADQYKATLVYEEAVDKCLDIYNELLQLGVSPEQARMILPQSMYTSYYTTGSLYAFARAYLLRSQEDAQKEIAELAKQWDEIIRPLFPISWSALVDK